MKTALILIILTAITLAGDYFIKVASGKPQGLLSWTFAIGILLYGLPAVGWFFLMRSHSLAVIGALYSVTTIILLTAMGVLIFKEPVSWREGFGIILAISAIVVIGQK